GCACGSRAAECSSAAGNSSRANAEQPDAASCCDCDTDFSESGSECSGCADADRACPGSGKPCSHTECSGPKPERNARDTNFSGCNTNDSSADAERSSFEPGRFGRSAKYSCAKPESAAGSAGADFQQRQQQQRFARDNAAPSAWTTPVSCGGQ